MGEVREAIDYVREDLEGMAEEAELLTKCDDRLTVSHYATVLRLRLVQLESDLQLLITECDRSIEPW